MIDMVPLSRKLDAKIVLMDDELFMREIISNTLSTRGYRDVLCVSTLDQVRDIVATSYPDLLILNGEMEQGRAIELVQQMRTFRLGRNPFVPAILTAWHPDSDFLGKVVDSGADVLVTKPLAADQLFARIDRLVNARPAFVATATYIGPDRRQNRPDNGFPKFDVPNTLREGVRGERTDPRRLDMHIAESTTRLKHQRKSMQDKEIGRHFAAFVELLRDGRSPNDTAFVLKSMTGLAETYGQDLSTMEAAEAAKPAMVLVGLLREIEGRTPDVSKSELDRVANLLGELGIGIPSVRDWPPQQRQEAENRLLESVN